MSRDWALLGGGLATCGVAAAIFFLTYANGGFFPTTRAYAAIAVWWLLVVVASLARGGAPPVSRVAVAAVGLLALFAVWTLVSTRWAPDSGRAFAQFDQAALYVGVLILGIVLARLVPPWFLVAGVALALTAVAAVALASRLFPSSFGAQAGVQPGSVFAQRLSFPLGYWNGLGIDVALAYPLLLAAMAARRWRLASAAAALPLPALAAVMYLTSSRGAFVAAGVAVAVYLLLAPHRWAALVATAVAAGGGAVSVATLATRHALLNGEAGPLGVRQGHHAALVIGIACIVSTLVWAGLAEVGRRIPPPPSVLGWGTAGLVVAVVVVGLVAAHPVARFDAFKNSTFHYRPGQNQAYDTEHLLTTSSNGRWQLWRSAVAEYRAHPLEGGGAGSWRSWWLHRQYRPFFTDYAHSLYLESLGELGIVGLVLIGAAVLVAVAGSVRSALELRRGEIAAAAACGTAFFAAAAYDWVWQLAGVAVVGVAMLGVALGARASRRASAAPARPAALQPALALLALMAVIPQFVLLAAGVHLRDSYAAALNGNARRARSEALAARAVEPWSATPYLQLAEIDKAEGRLDAARRWLDGAIGRSNDYSLWIAAAQIDTLRGKILLARHDLAELRRLYPRSQYLQSRS